MNESATVYDFGMDLDARFEEIPRARAAPPTYSAQVHKLSELNVEHELLRQYQAAKRLFEAAEHDETTPLNQKAQTLNSISSILSAIIKTQTELYDAERLKALEAVLADTLREFPELEAAFMTAYKTRLGI